MRSIFSLKVWCAAGAFWLAASAAHAIGEFPDGEMVSKLLGRGKTDGKPPFELPDALPGGGVKMFHRATAKNVYEYSQGGRIHVYRYNGADIAAEDFAAFAKGAEKFDEKASPSLAKQGACVTRQKETVTLWFVLDETVSGFEMPKEKGSLAEATKIAETVVNTENARIAKLFGNPERALTTFFKAVEKMDEGQIFRSLTTGGEEAAQSKLNRVRMMMPMMNLMMMEHLGEMMGGERPRQLRAPKIGKPEKLADGRVLIPVSAENLSEESVWFMFLVVATGQEKMMRGGGMMMNRRGNEPLWVPMAQVGDRWAVDLPMLSKTMFAKVEAKKEDGDCFNNLRQLILALKAFADDADDSRFPDKLSALVEEDYIADVKVFIAPKSATKIKDADEVDAKSDFTYEGAGKVDDGDGDTIIIYDKAGSHEGKGRHVAFADGHVQWVEEGEFKKLLEAQRAGRRNAAPPRGGFVPPNRGVVPMPMPEPVPDAPPPMPDDEDAPQAVPGGPPMEIQPMPARPRR
jgi:prepilin-type processing-associated H-X9-DG protein